MIVNIWKVQTRQFKNVKNGNLWVKFSGKLNIEVVKIPISALQLGYITSHEC